MNSIADIFKTSFILLGNITSAYSGSFKNLSPKMQRYSKEIKNIEYPSTRIDRQNLKEDCKNAVKEYRKSFKK